MVIVYMFKQKVLCVDIKRNLNLAIAHMPMFHPEVMKTNVYQVIIACFLKSYEIPHIGIYLSLLLPFTELFMKCLCDELVKITIVFTHSIKWLCNRKCCKWIISYIFYYLLHFNQMVRGGGGGGGWLGVMGGSRCRVGWVLFYYTWRATPKLVLSGCKFRESCAHGDQFAVNLLLKIRIMDTKQSCKFYHKICRRVQYVVSTRKDMVPQKVMCVAQCKS